MGARCLVHAKEVRDDGSIVEIAVWQLEAPLPQCRHHFKYRLFFGTAGSCRVRYDNESGKGDHRHVGIREEGYDLMTLDALLEDFERDVDNWRNE